MSFIDNLCKQLFPEDDEEIAYNNPDYYQIDGEDSMPWIIRIVEANADTLERGIYLFNIFKYLIRFPRKNGVEDLLKAKDYLLRLIDTF